jgi:hypothetical protein
MHRPTASIASIGGSERNGVSGVLVPKTVAWDREESCDLGGLEAAANIEHVKFDEKDVDTDGTEPINDVATPSYWRAGKYAAFACVCAVGLILTTTLLAVLLTRNAAPFNIENGIPSYSLEVAKSNASSPQARALKLINATTNSSTPEYRVTQRYALAVLYFTATSLADEGLGEDECSWFWNTDVDTILEGRPDVCDGEDRYQSLVLAERAFNGTIPSELDMLTGLRYINFRKSSVHGTIPTQL